MRLKLFEECVYAESITGMISFAEDNFLLTIEIARFDRNFQNIKAVSKVKDVKHRINDFVSRQVSE